MIEIKKLDIKEAQNFVTLDVFDFHEMIKKINELITEVNDLKKKIKDLEEDVEFFSKK